MLLLSLFEPCQRLGVLFLVQVSWEAFAVISDRFGPYLVDIQFVHVFFRLIDASEGPESAVPRRVGQKLERVRRSEKHTLPGILFDDPAIRRAISVILLA